MSARGHLYCRRRWWPLETLGSLLMEQHWALWSHATHMHVLSHGASKYLHACHTRERVHTPSSAASVGPRGGAFHLTGRGRTSFSGFRGNTHLASSPFLNQCWVLLNSPSVVTSPVAPSVSLPTFPGLMLWT